MGSPAFLGNRTSLVPMANGDGLILHTIGTSRMPASVFFETLQAEAVDLLIDVRLRNTSHLCGYAKRDDLIYFTSTICGMESLHLPEVLAPTPELLGAYRSNEIGWDEYASRFVALMTARSVEVVLHPDSFNRRPVLLCSESSPERCHRRLVAEYLAEHWEDVSVVHLPRSQ